jgi:hypothetical protein
MNDILPHWLVLLLPLLGAAAACLAAPPNSAPAPASRPVLREFIGLNTHTVQHRPELYAPVARHLRDYHPVEWDLGQDVGFKTPFPFARNGVDWSLVYGSWRKVNAAVDVCLEFESLKPQQWLGHEREAGVYAGNLVRALAPPGKPDKALISSVEIGNEPADFTPQAYRALFEPVARAIRQADPAMPIVTCAVMTGNPDRWSKPVSCLEGLTDLYDVLSIHTYPLAEPWPTWRRSYPEDPRLTYLSSVRDLIAWRDAQAPGKQIWITEFGYDASSKSPKGDGPEGKFLDVSDEEQARYLVRSILVFSAMDVQRAYIYFFNDADEPSFHAASGITRNFEPKPAYHAMAQLQKNLGDYRFSRVVEQTPDRAYVYEYLRDGKPTEAVWAAWSPTGQNREATISLPLGGAAIVKAQAMSTGGDTRALQVAADATGSVMLPLTESPLYLWLRLP